MNGTMRIAEGIYMIGGPEMSSPDDAASFIIECGKELIMIDSGAGRSKKKLVRNIESLYLDPARIKILILTHCHIDHIGAAPYFREHFGCALLCHELDAAPIETGDPVKTASTWYGVTFPATTVDRKISSEHEILRFGNDEIHCLHTPGHTPGSLSIYIDREGKRILFGQDIHGPFLASFGSDIATWKLSMKKLLDLKADILCEGHFGIFKSRERTESYIKGYLREYGE